MTSAATIARQVAVNCETRKIAYRQTKDGVVVSFVIHPNEVPDQLAIAPLGTRYVLALVELGDDEKPKGGDATEPRMQGRAPDKIKYIPVTDKTGTTVPKQWDDLPLSQQAGIRCGDPAFRKFLAEIYDQEILDTHAAATFVRIVCDIQSRTELKPNTAAGRMWQYIDDLYRAWQREAEVVPA